jgi:hypothetical protein
MAIIKPEQLRSGFYNITGSLFGTSSFAISASHVDKALVTASAVNDTITFTKGDGSSFPVTLSSVATASYALNALSSSYAATASFISTLYSSNHTQSFTNQSTWVVIHNLDTRYVIVQVYDTNFDEIIPQNIDLTNDDTVTISFPTLESGTAVVSVGGALQNNGSISSSYAFSSTSASFALTASYFSGSITNAVNAISASYALTASYALNGGSANIDTSSFATTGSNSFKLSQVITGSLTVTNGLYCGDSNIYIDSDDPFPFIVGYGSNSPLVKTNTVVGYFSLFNNSTGGFNVSIGNATMQLNTTGHSNTAVGAGSLETNTIGFRNTAVGFQAAAQANTYNSVAYGYQALYNGGSNNTALGYSAGKNASNISQRNVYIGYNTGPSTSVNENDKLYISNEVGIPLIGGDFATKKVDINGSLRVTGSLIVTGSTQGNVATLSVSSNTASLDLTQASFFTITLPSSVVTHISASNIQPGTTSTILVTTDGTSTVTFPSNVKQPSGSFYTASAVAAKDILTFISYDSSDIYLASVKNLI